MIDTSLNDHSYCIHAVTTLNDELARIKARNEKLERVREAAQETYQVLCLEYSYRQAEVNFGYLSKALKDCEAGE